MAAGNAVKFSTIAWVRGGKEGVGKKRRVEGGKTSGRSEASNAAPEAKGRGLSEHCC